MKILKKIFRILFKKINPSNYTIHYNNDTKKLFIQENQMGDSINSGVIEINYLVLEKVAIISIEELINHNKEYILYNYTSDSLIDVTVLINELFLASAQIYYFRYTDCRYVVVK